MSRLAALVVALATSACATPQASVSVAVTRPAPSEPAPPAASTGDFSELRASLRAPARVTYEPQSLGVAGEFVSIRVENIGSRTVPLPRLHATFATTRAGVAFPCNAHVGSRTGAIEPSHLDPGQSFTFERLLDCTMPLPGAYEVRLWIHAAEGEGDRDRSHAPLFVGSFPVDVASNGRAPIAIAARPGLFAFMTGATVSRPMPPDAWAKGGYHVAVALVNGSPRPVEVGRAHVTLLVFKRGDPLLGTERQQPLDEPAALAPGAVHVHLVPVTGVPSEEGRYEIVGRFAVGDSPEVEIGRVGLVVTQSPDLLQPTPEWPNLYPPPPLRAPQ